MDREARKRDVETSNKRVTTFWIMGSRKIAIFYRLFQDRSKRKVLNVRMEGLKIWRETIPSYFSRRGSRNSFFLPFLSYRSLFHSSHFLPLSPVISNYINRKYSENKSTILPRFLRVPKGDQKDILLVASYIFPHTFKPNVAKSHRVEEERDRLDSLANSVANWDNSGARFRFLVDLSLGIECRRGRGGGRSGDKFVGIVTPALSRRHCRKRRGPFPR